MYSPYILINKFERDKIRLTHILFLVNYEPVKSYQILNNNRNSIDCAVKKLTLNVPEKNSSL